jgi:hypothetical protein
MLAQLASLAVVRTVVESAHRIKFSASTGLAVAALTLGGCMPTTVPLAGADPADPGARVAGVGYRSTVAPYTSRRPSAPSAWRDQNDRAAPAKPVR